MNQPEISKADYKEWENNPVTKFIISTLNEQRKLYVEGVRSSVRAGEFNQASYKEGFIAGLETILEIDYEDVDYES